MQPVLNLWCQGGGHPKGWAGTAMLLHPAHPLGRVKDQIAGWVEAHPLGWLTATGPAVAVLVQLAAERLDLRIAGAAFVAPQDWRGSHGGAILAETPLSFPCVLFPSANDGLVAMHLRRLAAAWHARIAEGLPVAGPLDDAAMQAMMAERLVQLGPALQAAVTTSGSAGTAMKADRDLESSTAAIASRTSSMVRRTVQVASSVQSAQGT